MPVYSGLYNSLLQASNHSAIICRGESYSYEWLSKRVGFLSNWMLENTQVQQPIVLYCPDHPDTYALLVACLLTQRIPVPLHPGHPIDRNQRILNQINPDWIVSPIPFANSITPPEGFQPLSLTFSIPPENNIAYILFTSGSTGQPKGVMISWKALHAFFEAVSQEQIEVNVNDRVLQMFDLTFDLSFFSTLLPLISGATLVTVPEDEIKAFAIARLLEDEKITVALMVPSILNLLYRFMDDLHFPDLRESLFCGEALNLKPTLAWKNCIPNATLRNVYGPTEATIFCSNYTLPNNPEDWEHQLGIISIGKPMAGTTFTLDPETGELWIGGNQLFSGYWKDKEKTNDKLIYYNDKLVYRSGDRAFLQNTNWLFTGRIDYQVKIQGYRIELGEIEFQLGEILGNLKGVVLAIPNSFGHPELHAFIEDEETNAERWRNGLAEKVPAYMVPVHWHGLPEFPLNVNGKIDRLALKNLKIHG